jgi:hypothetical protein
MLETMRYADGTLCVLFNGVKLSTNVSGFSKNLKPNHFLAKTWSENEELAKEAFASGLFEDTGFKIPTGYVVAPVWKIKEGNSNWLTNPCPICGRVQSCDHTLEERGGR